MAISPRFHALLQRMGEIHDQKNQDYAGGEDPWRNFRKCEQLGIPAWKGVMVRLGDKWSRLETLAERGLDSNAVKDESFRDTALDMANYLLIMLCLVAETGDAGFNTRREEQRKYHRDNLCRGYPECVDCYPDPQG